MCHRCDLVNERKDLIDAAMENVDKTFFPDDKPAWADYDADSDPDGLHDPLMEAAAQLTPAEAFLLGAKLQYQMRHEPDHFAKTSGWLLAAMCAPAECP